MRKLLIVIFILATGYSAQAQLLRNIARSAANQAVNSVENRAEKEVDKQVDKGVNKAIDKALEEDSTKQAAPSQKKQTEAEDPSSKIFKKLGISTEVAAHKEDYKFTGQIVMIMEITDEKGKKAGGGEYTTCFNETNSDAMFKLSGEGSENTTTIFDQENSCMLILSESNGSKTGFATKFDPNAAQSANLPQTQNQQQTTNDSADDCTPSKTGKTKTISGYSCTEYSCETDEVSVSVWITKDFSAKNNKIFKNNSMGMSYKTDSFDGMVMQYESRSKKDKSSSVMTVKSIDMKKSSSFSTKGYQFTGLNFGGAK